MCYDDYENISDATGDCYNAPLSGTLNGVFIENGIQDDFNGADKVFCFSVTAADPYSASATETIDITVHPETNTSPWAQTDSYIYVEPEHDGHPDGVQLVTIRSSYSFDTDGDELSCTWTYDDMSIFDEAVDMLSLIHI